MIYVVTGTSRGIGLELVRQLLARGDHVVATARKPDDSSELQELAKAHKDSMKIVKMDVQDSESIKARSACMSHCRPNIAEVSCHECAHCAPGRCLQSYVLCRLRPRSSGINTPMASTFSLTMLASTPLSRGLASSTPHPSKLLWDTSLLVPFFKWGQEPACLWVASDTLRICSTCAHYISSSLAMMTSALWTACGAGLSRMSSMCTGSMCWVHSWSRRPCYL